jgi:hypothetical protein
MSKLTKFELDELEFKNQEYNRIMDIAEGGGLPECPNYVAHPQSVWFNEHWRPAIEQLKAENLELKNTLNSVKNCEVGDFVVYHPKKDPDADNVFDTFKKLKSELEAAKHEIIDLQSEIKELNDAYHSENRGKF